jgi:hypothetical protein
MPSLPRSLTALPVAGAFTGALVATASADSIVYVKDGNVWLTSPDAAKQHQVTFDGGKQFVRMNRSGQALNPPFDGIGTSGGDFYGPYEPLVSPDGKRIAYWFGQYSQRYDYGCSCYLFHRESKTAWTYSDRFTDPTAESENYLGLEQPEWLTNDRLLASYRPAKLTLTVRRASGKAVKGAIKTAGKPGINTLRFKGRVGGKTLRPGRYRLTITARAMVGGATAKATMAFRIVR